ncbi:HpcH/HpaI aldolase family protein [Natronosalvus caseinilyticus]|uniref:HpcH/HpaI aldolase family protein n=1 Tax=Natronosalvus caseinilyticus TaxID=2953747 RepID=UPI0028B106D0|nr:aldolase/citrate lyase family protein [Natronosalvus caseinilyticus]
MDQSNSFRSSIENGDVVFGTSADTFAPSLVELYGELGIDFVWLDFEHHGPSPWDSHVIENLTRAAELGGTELLVRVPESDPAMIRKVLDTGVRNILIPRVDTAEEARTAVEASRYVYQEEPGERGNSTARTNTWRNVDRYLKTEDEQVCIGVMIEKATATDNIEEILSVPDLGFAFIGPSDLSVQMGYPSDKNHPEVHRRVQEVREKCNAAGIPVGCIKSDPDEATKAIDDGYQIVRITSEFGAVQEVVRDRLNRIRS